MQRASPPSARPPIERPGPAPWASEARLAGPRLPDETRQIPYSPSRLKQVFRLLRPDSWTPAIKDCYALPHVRGIDPVDRIRTEPLYHIIVFGIPSAIGTVDDALKHIMQWCCDLGYSGDQPVFCKGEKGEGLRRGYAVMAFEYERDALGILVTLTTELHHVYEVDSLDSRESPQWVLSDLNPLHPLWRERLVKFGRPAALSAPCSEGPYSRGNSGSLPAGTSLSGAETAAPYPSTPIASRAENMRSTDANDLSTSVDPSSSSLSPHAAAFVPATSLSPLWSRWAIMDFGRIPVPIPATSQSTSRVMFGAGETPLQSRARRSKGNPPKEKQRSPSADGLASQLRDLAIGPGEDESHTVSLQSREGLPATPPPSPEEQRSGIKVSIRPRP